MEPLLQEIARLYGLSLSVEERIERGFSSENHALTDGTTRYFLKKYRFEDKKRVEEVHAAKKYFSEKGIPVILPIHNKDGDSFFFYNGGYYVLFPFVYGRWLERTKFTYNAIVSFGNMLGLLHRAGSESDLVMDDQFIPWNKDTSQKAADVLLEKIRNTNTTTPFDKLALSTVLLKKRLIEKNDLVYRQLGFKEDHLLHGDYLWHNAFFDDMGAVMHVFDLERTGYCARSYEIFRSMIYGFWDEDTGTLDLKSSALYFNSYRSTYPMDADEVQRGLVMFYLKIVHGFSSENEHYLKGNSRIDRYLLSDFQRITYLSKHIDDLATMLARGR